MAITSTRTLERIEVMANGSDDPMITIVYNITFDDSEDDNLPATTPQVKTITRYTHTTDDEGEQVQTATDVTGEDQMVQDVCAAVWTD